MEVAGSPSATATLYYSASLQLPEQLTFVRTNSRHLAAYTTPE